MTAQVRFSVTGFVTPVDAEAIKHGLKEAIRQIEQGQEIQKAYGLPDVPTASLITLAYRNSYKAYLEGIQTELREKIYADRPQVDGTDSGGTSREGSSSGRVSGEVEGGAG